MSTGLFPADIIISAREAQQKTGCSASITLAQWALESDYGRYDLGGNNPFGMKARPQDIADGNFVVQRTLEWVSSNLRTDWGGYLKCEAKFRKFPTILDAFIAHGELLMNPRGPYASALPFLKDTKPTVKYITAMAKTYATDPDYANKLIALVDENKLGQYDLMPGQVRLSVLAAVPQ
jgi:flagellum-specific peptidoglycan hydrolase FlgJ